MSCNCKKGSSVSQSSVRAVSTVPKGRGVNNGKSVSKVKRMIRRSFK
jgi:hypothetical protein